MAALAIPLIAAAEPAIVDVITALIHKFAPKAEADLGAGTGPIKFADVLTNTMAALDGAVKAGQMAQGQVPDRAIVAVIIQAVVGSLKLQGQLGPTPAPTPANTGSYSLSNQTITLTAGQVLTIQAKAA